MTDIFCSNLPNDQDMIRALEGMAIPMSLFTDCCFAGVGDHDAPLLIAAERKKIPDMVNSVNNGRFLAQLQVCKEMGCDVVALIVEGKYQSNPLDGLLEVPGWSVTLRKGSWHATKPPMMYSRFDQYLTELDHLAGVIVKRSINVRETADIIKALYTNFQKPAEEHQSLHQMFVAPPTAVELVRPSLLRRVAHELPGIGWEWSRVAESYFGSVLRMTEAGVDEWASLAVVHEGKSRRLGEKTAERVVEAIRG